MQWQEQLSPGARSLESQDADTKATRRKPPEL